MWVMRRGEPDWSDADAEALDAWLDESAAHQAAFWRLDHGWREADRIAALGPAQGRRPMLASPTWRHVAIAASVVVVLSFGALQLRETEQPAPVPLQAFTTEVGGRKLVPLRDGSQIELNTATALRASIDTRRREVWLDRGEAYFSVRHDPAKPFVVHAGDKSITVLGTRFSVRREGDKIRVAVSEGRVKLDAETPSALTRPEYVSRGTIAVAEGNSVLVARSSGQAVEADLAWRDGMIRFDQTTLAEAAAEFNRYNRRQLLVGDQETAAIRIGGSFQASNTEAFARLLQRAYGLQVEIVGQDIQISK